MRKYVKTPTRLKKKNPNSVFSHGGQTFSFLRWENHRQTDIRLCFFADGGSETVSNTAKTQIAALGFDRARVDLEKKTKTKNQQQLISLYLNVFLDFFSLLRLLLSSSQHFPRLHRDALKRFLAVIFGSAPLIGALLKPVSATFSSTLLSRTFGATGGKQTRINECRAWVEKKKSATSLLWAVAPYVLQWAACTLS